MAKDDMSRFVLVKMFVSDDCKGEYVCDGCGFRKPWRGESHTETRCENPNGQCNSLMKLHLDE